ncbi:hypothetical protein D3C76_1640250 [compost metagenome]
MLQALSQAPGISQREQDTDTFDHFHGAAARGGQHRNTCDHCLKQDHAERLMIRTQSKGVESLEITSCIGHLPEKVHLPSNPQFGCQGLQ